MNPTKPTHPCGLPSADYRYAKFSIHCQSTNCYCPAGRGGKFSFTFVSEEKKLIYFNVPKSASTTIRIALFGDDLNCSLVDPGGNTDDYLKFSFVRNPLDRAVSNWKMFSTNPMRIKQIESIISRRVGGFDDFISVLTEHHNHHWQPQSLFVPEDVDFIGRLENINQDFKTLCQLADLDLPPLPVLNRSGISDYREHYNQATLAKVAQVYAEDLRRFDYDAQAS